MLKATIFDHLELVGKASPSFRSKKERQSVKSVRRRKSNVQSDEEKSLKEERGEELDRYV